MSVDLAVLGKLVAELEERSLTVEAAIEEAEARLKMLRTIKQTLSTKAEPKPRGSRKKEPVAS